MLDKSSKVFLTEEPDLLQLKLKKKRVLRSLDENNDLTKEVFKEDNVLEKTANNEKLDDKKDLKKNDSNFEKDSTQKSKVDKQKEKLDQSDKKNLKNFLTTKMTKQIFLTLKMRKKKSSSLKNLLKFQKVLKIEGKES